MSATQSLLHWSDDSAKPILVIQPGYKDTSTALDLPGMGKAHYIDEVNRSFMLLLEHFSNATPPRRPTEGQAWFRSDIQYYGIQDGTAERDYQVIKTTQNNGDLPADAITILQGAAYYNGPSPYDAALSFSEMFTLAAEQGWIGTSGSIITGLVAPDRKDVFWHDPSDDSLYFWTGFTWKLVAGTGPVGDYVERTGDVMTGRLLNVTQGRSSSFGGPDPVSPPNAALADQTSFLELIAGNGGFTNSSAIVFHNPNISAAALEYVNNGENQGHFNFKSDDTAWDVRVNSAVVWNANNDGAGSGLDADLIDGIQGSELLTATGVEFKTAGSLRFGDNIPLQFGVGLTEVDIHWDDPNNELIVDLSGFNTMRFTSFTDDDLITLGYQDGVRLHQNDDWRLRTTDTGVEINEDLNVLGNVTVGGSLTVTGDFLADSVPATTRFANIAQIYNANSKGSFSGITKAGTLVSWGRNENAQVGHGADWSTPLPVTLPVINNVKFLSSSKGTYVTIAVGDDGRLWAWGDNNAGVLGIPGLANALVPTRISTNPIGGFVKVVCAGYVALALTSQGSLYAWGENNHGQLGVGDYVNRTSPTLVTSPGVTWADVYTNASATYAVDTLGRLWSTGRNNDGELAINSAVNNVNNFSAAVSGSGQLTDVKKILSNIEYDGGGSNLYVLRNNGDLYSAGYGASNSLGTGSTAESPIAVFVANNVADFAASDGDNTTVIYYKSTDNTLWGFGRNANYELGLGNTTARSTPVALGGRRASAVFSNGMTAKTGCLFYRDFFSGIMYAAGHNQNGMTGTGSSAGNITTWTEVLVPSNDPVVDVQCGIYATGGSYYYQVNYFLLQSGRLLAAGYGEFGSLGNGNGFTQRAPLQVVLQP